VNSSRQDKKSTDAVRFLIGILVLAATTRTAIAMLTTSWVFFKDGNSWSFGYEMGEIAASLALGEGFSWPDWSSHPQGPTAWMPPIYPSLIAATFKVFGVYSDQAAIFLLVFQTVASVLTCFYLYLIGRRVFNDQVGLLAAFLFAVYPPSINFTVRQIWSTSLFSCFLLILILSLLKLRTQINVTQSMRVGVLAAFTALLDPTVVVSYPFVALWLYVNSKRDRVDTSKALAAAVFLFCLGISPWLLRNYVVFGQYVFVKSNLGNELYLGNNTYATGSYNALRSFDSLTDAEREALKLANEPSRNKLLLKKAIAFITVHPHQFVRLTVTRFVHYWTFMMRPVEGWQQLAAILAYFAVLVLGMVGFFVSKGIAPDVQLLGLFAMTLPLPYYFTVVGLFRYRFPVETILVLLAAYTIFQVISRSRADWPLGWAVSELYRGVRQGQYFCHASISEMTKPKSFFAQMMKR
jgi:hypothetical protein